MQIPPPGSFAAMRKGCVCNMLVNQMGLGIDRYKRMFIVDEACTMHQQNRDYAMPPAALTEIERRLLRIKAQVRIRTIITAATAKFRRREHE